MKHINCPMMMTFWRPTLCAAVFSLHTNAPSDVCRRAFLHAPVNILIKKGYGPMTTSMGRSLCQGQAICKISRFLCALTIVPIVHRVLGSKGCQNNKLVSQLQTISFSILLGTLWVLFFSLPLCVSFSLLRSGGHYVCVSRITWIVVYGCVHSLGPFIVCHHFNFIYCATTPNTESVPNAHAN